MLLTGWTGDNGEAFENPYIPGGDATFTAQWSTDLKQVTFDYGHKMVWQESDCYRAVVDSSDDIWISGDMTSIALFQATELNMYITFPT